MHTIASISNRMDNWMIWVIGLNFKNKPKHTTDRWRSWLLAMWKTYSGLSKQMKTLASGIHRKWDPTNKQTRWWQELNKGDPLAKGTSSPTGFWRYLETWGGTWMWEGIDEAQTTKRDLIWLVEGIKTNSLVWVTDGSYDWKRAADLSGAGWIIFCLYGWPALLGNGPQWQVHFRQKCMAYAPCISLPERFWSSTRSRSGQLHCVATTIECLSYNLTPATGYGLAQNAQTFCAVSRQQYTHSQENSCTCMCICNTLAKHAVISAMMECSHNRPTQLLPKEEKR